MGTGSLEGLGRRGNIGLPSGPGTAHHLIGQRSSGHLDRLAGRDLAGVVNLLDPKGLPRLGKQEAADPAGILTLALLATTASGNRLAILSPQHTTRVARRAALSGGTTAPLRRLWLSNAGGSALDAVVRSVPYADCVRDGEGAFRIRSRRGPVRLGGQDRRYAAVRHVERTVATRPSARAVLVAEARRRGHREPHRAESQTVGADPKKSAHTVSAVS